MHDPCTVAHEIKSPFRGRPSSMWPKGYRPSLITIWHVDPEDRAGKCGIRRSDDTCGWFTPTYSPADRERIHKLGLREYRDIWGKQWALAEGKDYARICFEPTTYDAIYWAWRAIKYSERKGGWKYGERRPALTPSELEEIYVKQLLDFERGDCCCRWPCGNPGQPGFFFCGGDIVIDRPYCDFHTRIATGRSVIISEEEVARRSAQAAKNNAKRRAG